MKPVLLAECMNEEAIWAAQLLPDHYLVVATEKGVECLSPIGIDDSDEEHWHYIMMAIRKKFPDRFLEVFHTTCTDHRRFTIYLKPVPAGH